MFFYLCIMLKILLEVAITSCIGVNKLIFLLEYIKISTIARYEVIILLEYIDPIHIFHWLFY